MEINFQKKYQRLYLRSRFLNNLYLKEYSIRIFLNNKYLQFVKICREHITILSFTIFMKVNQKKMLKINRLAKIIQMKMKMKMKTKTNQMQERKLNQRIKKKEIVKNKPKAQQKSQSARINEKICFLSLLNLIILKLYKNVCK